MKKSFLQTKKQTTTLNFGIVGMFCVAGFASIALIFMVLSAVFLPNKAQAITTGLATYQAISLQDKTKQHVLFFNADWCARCKVHKSDMQKLLPLKPDSIIFYDIDIDDSINAQLIKEYAVRVYPTYVQIDSEGKTVLKSESVDSYEQIVAKIVR